MPEYVYRDEAGHICEVTHGMLESPDIVCDCGRLMKRVPQPLRINWGGIRDMHPKVKRFIDDAPSRREKFAEEHEAHERATQI